MERIEKEKNEKNREFLREEKEERERGITPERFYFEARRKKKRRMSPLHLHLYSTDLSSWL